jgi:hypothetical protein
MLLKWKDVWQSRDGSSYQVSLIACPLLCSL